MSARLTRRGLCLLAGVAAAGVIGVGHASAGAHYPPESSSVSSTKTPCPPSTTPASSTTPAPHSTAPEPEHSPSSASTTVSLSVPPPPPLPTLLPTLFKTPAASSVAPVLPVQPAVTTSEVVTNGGLAFTGPPIGWLLAGGLTILAVGALLVRAASRGKGRHER